MKKRVKNIIVLGVNPYSGNRGVGALAYSIIFLLKKIEGSKNADFNIFIKGSSKTISQSKIDIDGNQCKVTFFPLIVGNGFLGIVKFIASILISIKIIIKSDYILDIGEGDSFSDIYGSARFKQINTPKKLFSFFNKKLLLLPQTIGPFSDDRIKKQAIQSIEKSKVVLARDKMSYDYVINNTKQKNIDELIDIAFFMPFEKSKINNGKINVGLNISSLMWHGGYTKNNQFGFNVEYQKLTRDIIKKFVNTDNVQLHLVPHVLDMNSHVENDYEVSLMLQKEFSEKDIVVSPFFLNPIDAKSYISGLDFFTGARMHACIAAFSSNVPVFPLAYSRKFNGLFKDTLDYQYLGDLINSNENEILNSLFDAFNNRMNLYNDIKSSSSKIVKTRYDILISKLEKFLDLC